MTDMKDLVAGDSPTMRHIVTQLNQPGYVQVEEAGNGQEALDAGENPVRERGALFGSSAESVGVLRRILDAQPQSPGFSRHLSGVRWTLHQCPRIGTLARGARNGVGLCGDATWRGIFRPMVRRWCIRPRLANGVRGPGGRGRPSA